MSTQIKNHSSVLQFGWNTDHIASGTSRYSIVNRRDGLASRVFGGLVDIIIGVVKAAFSPFKLALGNPKGAIFDLLSPPLILTRSIACLTGSTKVYDFFEKIQGALENKINSSSMLSL